MTLEQYIHNINDRYKRGNATEHTFRGDLQQLIESLVKDVKATNEPKRQSCGAPDYILTQKEIPVGFIEAKNIGDKDLDGLKKTGNKEQFDRYKTSLNNLIFTDYLDFHLYREGVFITKVSIGLLSDKGVDPLPINFDSFTNLIKDFCTHVGQTIKSSKKLAEMMAGKARLLSEVIERALISDETHHEDSTLKDQMLAFKQILIHDITPKGFADVYAQTIAYGMFAARLHDATLPTFSRQEAAELIPKSNPFLRKLFGYIAGPDIDDRIKWIVDSLVEIFLACNVAEILKNYGKQFSSSSGGGQVGADPIIHFYETFLSEYDPKLRKARGVWYTPAPVVNFIVRAVDDILKSEFDLPQGLADTSKTKIKINLQATDRRYKENIRTIEQEVHKVQILDPATGTGTFLAEVVKHIHKKFVGQQGIWSNYVETHLLPRLNGFELLMASYAMAHLKLDLLLTETGYSPLTPEGGIKTGGIKAVQRLRVYLTNSLEEHHQDTGTLFANWLSSEANEANHIKRDSPVMCVIGNPPYSVSSTNKSEWIEKLIEDYKKDLNERNIQSLSDDYVKFIRFGQHFIDKNTEGVLAYISNNSFIDGITHRQMRKSLLESFDKIYILDLHGSSKRREVADDGSRDENVFDIQQGVSINIFIKTGKKKKNELAKVFQTDLKGLRNEKYQILQDNSLNTLNWQKLDLSSPQYFFVKKDFDLKKDYETGFGIHEIFPKNASGITTERDDVSIHFETSSLNHLMKELKTLDNEIFRNKYTPKPDGRDWKIETAKQDLLKNTGKITNILYRPFDFRKTYYSGKSKGFMSYPRNEIMQNFKSQNLGIVVGRQGQVIGDSEWNIATITNTLVDCNIFYRGRGTVFPLYIYSDAKDLFASQTRTPNLNPEILRQITEGVGLQFVAEKETGNVCFANNNAELRDDFKQTFAPIDLLDYIYAVLHSPDYREKYKEFLKIDFPRVPYPRPLTPEEGIEETQQRFWSLVKLGGELRQIHLLESPVVENYITQYPIDGSNTVTKPVYQDGNVYINETQYFKNVPEVAWNFYIGGYQPAQKWLKDRRERVLEFEDILHYQKIIVALSETDRLMQEIEGIEIE